MPTGEYCRRFAPEIDQLAAVWSTTHMASDQWSTTGRKWGTNSKPFEVKNQNNLRGVAKPGDGAPADKCLRAAHEKISSDLAYMLGLPISPVTLWDRGEGPQFRYVAVSAWAFPNPVEWHIQRPKLSEAQVKQAGAAAGAMRTFDTWLAASDRKNDHVLVSDDGDGSVLRLAYIDYAFSLSYEWIGVAGVVADPRAAFPSDVVLDTAAVAATVKAIEALPEGAIGEIVGRIPSEYFSDGAKDAIMHGLLSRRAKLRGWLGVAAAA
jgi:hypothetical protein